MVADFSYQTVMEAFHITLNNNAYHHYSLLCPCLAIRSHMKDPAHFLPIFTVGSRL
jgi:hypothetical protein